MDSGAPLRVTLLGAFQVCRGETVVPVPGARLRGLLARLALAGGRPVGPGVLVDALWPEERPADPANALQSLVSRLRKMVGVAQVEGGYRLEVAEDDVDALRFERLAAAGRDCLRAGDPATAARLLGEAMACWPGRRAAQSEPPAVAAVAPAAATRLALASVEAGAGLAEAELALGRAPAAAARLTDLLAEQPAHERVAALLMDALAAQGRQAEALALYERVRETLVEQLGTDPGAALRERHLRLLHAPERPEIREKPGLPAPLTSFIGRDDDLARIDTLLAAGRLVTVLGPGGAGKTRLALEAARRRRHEYPDGTWLADLASVTEPTKVTAAVLAAIGSRAAAFFEVSGLAKADGDELDVLTDQLNGRESLLLIDNCEHLIDAVAHLTAALLPRCAGLRILATSREPLAVDGEALVPLGPLTLPEPADGVEEARRTASVRLFAERAAAVRPGFDVDTGTLGGIVRIVRGLDGMPLALELAAARLRTLSLTELADGLSDRFRVLTSGNRTALPRHRTLRAVIAWSWDVLGEHERAVAERISVLPGGVTVASAIAVCAGEVPAAEVPELLAALVDRSLLQLAPDPGRYRMLETLREYGIDRLAEQGTLGAVRGLAARYLTRLMARHDPALRGPGQLVALGVIRAEYDNALAALRHLCDTGDSDGAISLTLSLAWFWQMFGRHLDATYWLEEALAVPFAGPTLNRDSAEAVLLLTQINSRAAIVAEAAKGSESELRSLVARLLGYPELPGLSGALTAIMLAFMEETEQALALIQEIVDGPDVWLAGLARMFRAQFAENDGNLEQVRVDVAAALECFRAARDRWGLATALPMRALLRQYDGDLDGALTDLTEARKLAREFGSLSLSDEIFIDLRWIDLHLRLGDAAGALDTINGTRERAERLASAELIILVNAMEAGLWIRIGDLDRAEEVLTLAETGLAATLTFGAEHGEALVSSARAALSIERGDVPSAEAALAKAYAAALESRDSPILALVALTAATLAGLKGQFREAAVVLGAASRLRGAHDRTDPQIARLSRLIRAEVGEDGFAEAYEMGWKLDGKTASAQVDPARLRQPALPGPDQGQARRA